MTKPDKYPTNNMTEIFRPGSRREWFNLVEKDEATSDIYLYDDIGMFGITAKDFSIALQSSKAENLNIYINSNGGDVDAGLAIFNSLKRHSAKKTIYIDGFAASIASVIAMAGDTVIMPETALMFVHKPWTITAGNADDLQRTAEQLDKWEAAIVAAYVSKTGKDAATISAMLRDERLLSSDEAIELGFADKSTNEEAAMQMSYRGAIMAKVFAKIRGVKNMADEPAVIETPAAPEVEPVITEVAPVEPEPVVEPIDEPAAVEPEPAPESVEAPVEAEPVVDARAEFKRFVARFGADRAARYFAADMSFDDAQAAYMTELEAENAELKSRASAQNGVLPVPVKPVDPKEKKPLFNVGK